MSAPSTAPAKAPAAEAASNTNISDDAKATADVPEATLESYRSAIVPLPPSVPELIQCCEKQHERCAQMTRFVERICTEALRLVPDPKAPLNAAISDAAKEPSSSAAASGAAAASAPAAVVARGVVAGSPEKSTTGSSTSTSTSTSGHTPAAYPLAGSVVRGTVFTGKIVSGAASTSTGAAGAAPVRGVVASATAGAAASPSASAASSQTSAPGTAKAPTSSPTSLVSPEELRTLRARAMALEAMEQLLASTQDAMKVAESNAAIEKQKRETAEMDLAQLQQAALSDEMAKEREEGENEAEAEHQHRSTAELARLQEATTRDAHDLKDVQLRYECALYALAQLKDQVATTNREKAYLYEKNTHLEGQLQRLLMSSMENAGPTPSPRSHATSTTAASGTSSSSTQRAAPQSPSTASTVTTSAPRLTASEIYQKAALEKQVTELQAMTDKLTSDLKKQSARRAKVEDIARNLQRENGELKAAALQVRRQINESELEAERAVSRKEEDDRMRQMERDGDRLRTIVREQAEQYHHDKAEWARQKHAWDQQALVQRLAANQLLKRLLAYQVREATLRQCDGAAAQRKKALNPSDDNRVVPAAPTEAGATPSNAPHQNGPTRGTTAIAAPTSLPVPSHFVSAASRSRGSSSTVAPATAVSEKAASASHTSAGAFVAGPVGAAADTATLVDRERQLDELKHTFERRVALVEAQRNAEVQQMKALNRELRQALTTSQEELTLKNRLLEAAQRQQRQPQPLPLPSSAISVSPLPRFASTSGTGTPLDRTRSAPSLADWRESSNDAVAAAASAWMARPEPYEDGNSVYSNEELEDSRSGVSGFNPLAQSPAASAALSLPRLVTEIERRYDPEHMSTWEAVQVENEALLDRLTTMQEEKWTLTSFVEDLQRQSQALREELKRNASTMKQLLTAGVATPAAMARGGAESSLRALQCLLQETLQEKFTLEEQLRSLTTGAGRGR